ncbi:helix-turn-helix domain-containing protein [Bombiscardovia coagulans]|uniref:Helix-turn-helix domain-containing protein n=1 Tax=Bombiscardovia coagulans TaxID=686666 RepID=A0A261ESS0_9BIFI|nr:helix-turn-helix domain-containing protein [Bombiscardovia coagulans]OZG49903.1 hypothetical protein BOCO_0420 [Bombiscardovia coagulans]
MDTKNTNNTNGIETSELLTPQEVASLLAIPISTLARWRQEQREIAYIRFGKYVRYRREDVNSYITDHTVEPRE